MIEIINPGLLSSIQDLGRPGYFHLGIPVSGAMDQRAMRIANLLVGNEEDAAVLESVFIGPEIRFGRDMMIAVTGADIRFAVDGESKPGWSAVPVKAGQTIKFEFLRRGARVYIAFSGGIDTKAALGSRSTYVIGALGGLDGKTLSAGDKVPIGESAGTAKAGRSLPETWHNLPADEAELRVLPGLYWHRLTEEAQANFFADSWKVSSEADRMGYRFRNGRPLSFVEREQPFGAGSDPSNIVDSCYPYGSIQVPSGTEPIVLHRDAVSGGGYFMLGTVISADMDIIGQLQPNHTVRFVRVSMDEALAARQERKQQMDRIRDALS